MPGFKNLIACRPTDKLAFFQFKLTNTGSTAGRPNLESPLPCFHSHGLTLKNYVHCLAHHSRRKVEVFPAVSSRDKTYLVA